jgi:hypothetical protein
MPIGAKMPRSADCLFNGHSAFFGRSLMIQLIRIVKLKKFALTAQVMQQKCLLQTLLKRLPRTVALIIALVTGSSFLRPAM